MQREVPPDLRVESGSNVRVGLVEVRPFVSLEASVSFPLPTVAFGFVLSWLVFTV